MSAASHFRYVYLAYLSKPKAERRLYREIRRRRPRRLVEVGIGNARRTLRMLQVANRFAAGELEYTGIDLFEARGAGADALSLKEAHRLLKPMASRVRLLPGDANLALSMAANTLTGTDLLLISSDQDAAALEQAWFFVPRMLHADSLVLRETPAAGDAAEATLSPVSRLEIEACAAAQAKVRRRAA